MEVVTPVVGAPKPPFIIRFCDAVIRWTILVLAGLVPVFFLPWTIEVIELNKQLLLVVGAAIAGMAWIGKMLAERKFEYRRSVVNIIVLLFVTVYAISAAMSQSQYMSLVGDFGQEKAGLVTVGALAILYFVIINNIRTVKALNRLLTVIVIGGFIAGLYAVLQGFGLFILPFAFAKAASFNSVGTISSLCFYLVFVLALASGQLISGHNRPAETAPKRKALKIANTVLLALTGVITLWLVAAVDYWPVTTCLIVASALLVAFAFVHAKSIKGIAGILMPIAAIVVGLLLLMFRFPVGLQFPTEVMPSMKASMDIVVQTLRERPFFGSGPGTFIMDYAKFHAPEVNQTYFWNIRFDRGASRILTMTATNGLLGTLSWVMLGLFLVGSAARKLFRSDEETWHLTVGVFAAFAALFVAKFIYSSTVSLEFATWLGMALLVIVHRKEFFSVKFENSPRAAMVLSFIFILGLVFSLSGLVVEGQRYAAEVSYAQAIQLDQAGGDVDQVISHLTNSANLNRANDVYLRNLALAALAKANKEAAAPVDVKKNEGETDAAYKDRVDLAKQDKIKLVAQLAANAVNIAKQASDMNPTNVANWSVLASVYSNLFGVTAGADEWAVTSYEKAVELEPSNPALRTELGKVYLYQAGQATRGVDPKDEKAKQAADDKVKELLNKAAEAFNKAIELKSDYAPGHYYLALTLDSQGKLKDAISRMESAVVLNPRDVGVGFQLSLLYFRDGRKDEAIAVMEQVIRLMPTYSNARWYLAAMYEDKGDLDKAIEQITKVKEANPDLTVVQQRLDQLNAKKAGAATAVTPEGLPQPVDKPVVNPNEPGVKKP